MTISANDRHCGKGGSLRAEMRLLGFVWRSASGRHLRILLPMLVQIFVGLFPASVTYYVQAWITGSEDVGSLLSARNLLVLLGLILAMTLLKQLSGLAQGYAMTDVRRNIELRYVAYLADRQSELCGMQMNSRNIMAFSKESEMLTGLIPMVYRSFIQAPLTVVSFLCLMIWLSWQLALVMLLLVGVVVYCCVVLRRRVKSTRRRLYDRMADLYQLFSDWLNGYRVLRFYDSEGYMCRRLSVAVEDSSRMYKRLVGISCLQGVAVELLTYAGVVAFVFIVALGRQENEWRILLTYPLAIMFIRSEAIKIVQGYSQLAATESSVSNITAAFESEYEKEEQQRQKWTEKISSVEFRGVSFSYPDGTEVLRDASGVFRTGGLNVIAGESGAGKSTCLDLISRALMPCRGCVLFSGTDSAGFDRRSLTGRMAIVEQEPFLFEGTILDNLTFGRPVPSDDILEKFRELRLSHLADSEEDLHKEIACDGRNLSVGEKQRIAFIRALLKNPDVILLDEATSAVDSTSVAIMTDYVKRISLTTLVISVSHDPFVISSADNLFFLRNGKLFKRN